MPVIKRIHERGANITVEANGEVLFMPGGVVHNWTNRFTGRIRAATIMAAPVNKRPRWGHYGKPLKATIISARPKFRGNGHDQMMVHAAVGATAPHSYYVDQGTGVYAGNGPYEAKILPPWHRGSPSLYESTWRPGGPKGRRVAPVMIRGQQGQFFFDTGLRSAFASMRMRSFEAPTEPKISSVLDSVATGLEGFLGNTASTPAFLASLAEWRGWRDAAWRGDKGPWGAEGVVRLRHSRPAKKFKELKKVRTVKQAEDALNKALAKPKIVKPKRKPVNVQQRKADRATFIAAMIKKYGSVELPSVRYENGYWYVTVPTKNAKGRTVFKEVRAKAKS